MAGLSYPGATVIDVTDTEDREISGHIYHLHNPAVREDLRRTLGTADALPSFARVSIGESFKLRRLDQGVSK